MQVLRDPGPHESYIVVQPKAAVAFGTVHVCNYFCINVHTRISSCDSIFHKITLRYGKDLKRCRVRQSGNSTEQKNKNKVEKKKRKKEVHLTHKYLRSFYIILNLIIIYISTTPLYKCHPTSSSLHIFPSQNFASQFFRNLFDKIMAQKSSLRFFVLFLAFSYVLSTAAVPTTSKAHSRFGCKIHNMH